MNDTSNEKPGQNPSPLDGNPMSEEDFQKRLWANPEDSSAEFLAAANSTPARESQWQQARQFNRSLASAAKLVQAPASLQDKLLKIPELAANDDSFIRRLLPVAALLLLAISIGLYFQPEANAELANDLLSHIYLEEPYFGDGSVIAVSEVNARIDPVMADKLQPGAATDSLSVTFAKDCYIAKQRSMHLVVKGKTGPVNVVMIPSRVVDTEMKISDQRFNGLVTPASGGTLVIIGNKQEPIAAYRDQLASSLNWEY